MALDGLLGFLCLILKFNTNFQLSQSHIKIDFKYFEFFKNLI